MMQVVRSWLLLSAVAIVAALYGFATPALAHGAHNSSPAAQAAHVTKANKHDVGNSQSSIAEVATHIQDSRGTPEIACCGVLCMAAAPQNDPHVLIIESNHSSSLPPLHPELLGRGPARLDRPPTA
jgi:hypothetical protein